MSVPSPSASSLETRRARTCAAALTFESHPRKSPHWFGIKGAPPNYGRRDAPSRQAPLRLGADGSKDRKKAAMLINVQSETAAKATSFKDAFLKRRVSYPCRSLSTANWSRWLSETNVVPEEVQNILKPFPAADRMRYKISSRVNSVKNDDAKILETLKA